MGQKGGEEQGAVVSRKSSWMNGSESYWTGGEAGGASAQNGFSFTRLRRL